MHIAELLAQGRTFSFEFGPPRSEEAEVRFWQAVERLRPLDPSFVSVTYGAAGSTREGTRQIVLRMKDEIGWTTMPHLACIAHSRADVSDIICDYRDLGFDNLLALRGDPPRDQPDIPEGDFKLAIEIVELARELADFSVGVALHPEGHPHAPDPESDRRHQAAKLKVADFGITQFFFRREHYLSLVDDMAALGVDRPIIAGVIPVTNLRQVQRMTMLSGGTFPDELARRLEDAGDDARAARRIGVEHATALCRELIDEGVPGIHFYTLNQSLATRAIFRNLEIGGA